MNGVCFTVRIFIASAKPDKQLLHANSVIWEHLLVNFKALDMECSLLPTFVKYIFLAFFLALSKFASEVEPYNSE